ALRRRELNVVDLLDAACDRHESFGAELHAYKLWSDELAQRQARAADIVFETGIDLGPLQGLPVSVKDLYGVQGYPTYAGTPRRLPPEWEREGPLVRTLRRQLAVITGKTHTVELAFGGLGVNNHWGTPRNPWDAERHRVPGGSSSGAAVSLCEGSALLALGTDTAGSVRIPASMTGTVGLKTSAERWPIEGIVPLSSTLDTAGVLARSVLDVAYAFAALDPEMTNAGRQPRPVDVVGLRVGIGDGCLWEDCDPGVAEAVRTALDEAAARGARLHDQPMPEAAEAIELLRAGSVVSAECDAFLSTRLPEWRDMLDPIVTSRIADGGSISAREYLQRLQQLETLADAVQERFQACDVIASPTVPITPPALDEVSELQSYRQCNFAALRNTCVANYLGLCAISTPVGLDRAGLPVGLQLLAPYGEEERLLAVALAFEAVLGAPRERLGSPPLCIR
ncbi:MAG: amidase, partial [Gammaproteobacteria bacterium]|nr:amidase [Gammaproteobacteria bacterium]NIR81959.1 amidase [Gammaproteobacteria bacterium]NIR89011.1 amidase [Gammaproteobacteria bacterium]NIU03066.1 amidase [Gammaproteobacteria bacterium]NIV50590.1 amidase [Gammaproteobacteria bacterium]